MRNSNTIGVDLAKNVIQVSVVNPLNKELSNKELTRTKFAEFLAKQKPRLVAFEACATAHHWARLATAHGHHLTMVVSGLWHWKVSGLLVRFCYLRHWVRAMRSRKDENSLPTWG